MSLGVEIRHNSRWISRGWVFQERALSNRILFFAKRCMFWSCTQGQATEIDPRGWGSMGPGRGMIEPFEIGAPVTDLKCLQTNSAHQSLLDLQNLLELHGKIPKERFDSVLHNKWCHLVYDYSNLDLTMPVDKLVAISGVAKSIQSRTGSRYCAGIWHRCLPDALLWYVVERQKPRPTIYRAPTWSWASVDGVIGDFLDSVTEVARIDIRGHAVELREVEVVCNPIDSSMTGQVSDGYLKLLGRVKRVERLSIQKSFREDYDVFDEESLLLGTMTPDTVLEPPEDLNDIYLLFVMVVYANDENGELGYLGGSGYRKVAAGLVLKQEQDYFRRIGILIHPSKDPDPHIVSWFSSCPDMTITIR
jgi:hypothetical protein